MFSCMEISVRAIYAGWNDLDDLDDLHDLHDLQELNDFDRNCLPAF